MAETKFTPGPLRASSDRFAHVVLGMDGAEIATVREFADAVLFAAAPELLAALEAVVAISDRKHDAWDAAKAAIAKAKGEA